MATDRTTGSATKDARDGARDDATLEDRLLPSRLDRVDRGITRTMGHIGIPLLRISVGIVFLWFGVLKFFPGLSPAQDLAARTIGQLTFGVITPEIALPVLAVWECAIGIGLLAGRFLRLTLLLLFLQLPGTFLPLVFFPAETFLRVPYAPTLEGQYIIKNLVIIAAGIVIGATVRGGQLEPEPKGGPQVPRG